MQWSNPLDQNTFNAHYLDKNSNTYHTNATGIVN